MTGKIMKKAVALGAALALTVCGMAGCGSAGSAGGSADGGDAAGRQETWGNLSVLVPEDMYLTGGSVTDEQDPDSLWLQDAHDQFKYYVVTVVDGEQLETDIKQSVAINEGETKDGFKVGGNSWHGMTYTFNDKPGFQVGAEIGGVTYEVSCYGYDLESDRSQSILASVGPAA